MEITIELIKEKVCEHYGVDTSVLNTKDRKRVCTDPKKVVCYLSTKLLNYSVSKLAKELGGINHSTVIYHRRVCDDLIFVDPKYRRIIRTIESKLLAA